VLVLFSDLKQHAFNPLVSILRRLAWLLYAGW
jgi:hypothetical protein